MTDPKTQETVCDEHKEQYFNSGYVAGKRDASDTSLLPNPVRLLPSHGVEDQTSEEFQTKKSCTGRPRNPALPTETYSHHMVSVKTGSTKVPFVEQCTDCSYIDASSLEWWADNAVKMSLSERARRMAVAIETEPFAFVQSSSEELPMIEVLGQALGAASVCWVGGTGSAEFDSSRAKAVYEALAREVERFQRIALEAAATRAVDYVLKNNAHKSADAYYSAIRNAIQERT